MILVTGATGEIGRAVVDSLLAQGIPVRATSRNPSQARLPGGVDVVQADLGDASSVAAAVSGVDGVFLLTGGSEIPSHDKTVATVAASAGVRRVVKLSSGRVGRRNLSAKRRGAHVLSQPTEILAPIGREFVHVQFAGRRAVACRNRSRNRQVIQRRIRCDIGRLTALRSGAGNDAEAG